MASPATTVSINLIGTGCTIVCGTIKNEHWKKIEKGLIKSNSTLQEFISSENNLRFLELEGMKTWKDIGNEFFLKGMIESTRSIVELKIGDSKKISIPFREILHQEILFSIYSQTRENKDLTDYATTNVRRAIVVETEIGKLGSIKFTTPEFNIDKLVFQITDVKVNKTVAYSILSKITYDGKVLIPVKPDTLVSGFYCLHE